MTCSYALPNSFVSLPCHAQAVLLRSNGLALGAGVSRSPFRLNDGECSSFTVDCKLWNDRRLVVDYRVRAIESSREHRRFDPGVAGKARAQETSVEEDKELQEAKYGLLNVLLETGRGVSATAEQRAIVEEALVAVQKFDAGTPLELNKLDGTWLLQYTTAPDVMQILQAARTPFFQVGQIFQKFECVGRTDGGVVKNVVRWSIPQILQKDDGATLVVTAKFSVVSFRSIALSFEEAQLGQIAISEGLQGLVAPAVLPRTFLNLEVLQFFRTLDLRVPLGPANLAGSSERLPVGLWYYIIYLDHDMLLGRALGNGGVFIFSRTQDLRLS